MNNAGPQPAQQQIPPQQPPPHQPPAQQLPLQQVPPQQPTATIPEDSLTESESIGSWDTASEASYEDDSEEDDDSNLDPPVGDEEYWEDDAAADTWLARYPGGTRLLYPRLFLIKSRNVAVTTPPRDPSEPSLLHSLPREIRNQIYEYYFQPSLEGQHPEEEPASFHDNRGKEIERIQLSSEDVELKFWVSTALSQASRQLRVETMPVLFKTRVFTVEWLQVLPRFVEFLGQDGCAMVRYVDILDTFNLHGDNNEMYMSLIANLSQFPHLHHLRIVLSWGLHPSNPFVNRVRWWFDANEWTARGGNLKVDAVPKLRSQDVELHWPEYNILKSLKAQKFTLALDILKPDKYAEFDGNYGAFPEISNAMQSNCTTTETVPSPSFDPTTSSISAELLESSQVVEVQNVINLSTFSSNSESDHEDFDHITWQDTDTLPSKSMAFYNYVRQYFHDNIYILHPERRVQEGTWRNFIAFPTAPKSTGSIMRDCAFCYLRESHCGYHAMPNQLPFEPKRIDGDGIGVEDNPETLEKHFKDMSYVDMRNACQGVVQQMDRNKPLEFRKAIIIFRHIGWFEFQARERLEYYDAAVEFGVWVGQKIDKEEVTPWDVFFHMFWLETSPNKGQQI
jgi:hypothetical protein